MTPAKPRGAIGATGYESRHASRYYAWRQGKRRKQRFWPKLTAALEAQSHLFLPAHVSRGPGQDSPQYKPAARAAAARCRLGTLLGDMAYGAGHNRGCGRRRLKTRSTLFPLNRRNSGRRWPQTKYRRQMKKRSRERPRRSRYRRVYGQRWQVEGGWSRNKRLLGSALRARTWVNQKKEIPLRVITHNLMLLAAI